jgi:hypothetical protein
VSTENTGGKSTKPRKTSAKAVAAATTAPAPAQKPRTLRESANQFLADIGHILYTRNKKLGDLMAIEKEVANLLNIGHPILDEPVE